MSDTQKHTKPNVPNLRFPGFSGEWERMKASDLLDFFSTNSLSWEQLEYGGTGLLNLHYGLIHNGLPTQIDINDSLLPAIKTGNEPRKFTLCTKGDIAFADASEDTNDVGKVVEFVDCAGKNVVCGLHTIHGRDKLDKTVPGFKGYSFSSKAFHDQIKRIAQGTKVFSISAGNFEEVYVGIPGKEEQKKIAALLSLIDQRISIQNKVIEDLITLEKEIIHHVFKTLNTVSKPLSIISERVTARNTNALCNNVLTISARDGLISQLDFFNKSVASHNLSNYILLKKGDFAYNKSYSADHPWGAIKHLEIYEEGVLSPLYFCFRPLKDHIDTEYLQLYFETDLWHKHISDISVEGARNHGLLNMSVGDCMALPVPVPELTIQHDIARSLKSLRNKKSNERKYREFLLRQKTYLLSHLFL